MTLKPGEETGVTESIVASEPELLIEYFEDTDTLVLGSGIHDIFGETVARNLVAMSGDDHFVTSVVLEHAAELLRPILFPDSTAKE